MKVSNNKLPVPAIGQSFKAWSVVSVGVWGRKEPIAYYQASHPCGNTRKFTSSQLWAENFKDCKKCEAFIKYRKGADELIKNSMYRQYKYSAKKREYSFLLNKKEFSFLIKSNCFYCESEPNQKRIITEKKRSVWHEGEFLYVNGIDRFDNSLGYTLENSVTCCKICNFAKGAMQVEDFKDMIKKWNNVIEKTDWKNNG